MIESVTGYFDWVNSLPIQSQCRFAIALSFTGFSVAAIARETCKHSGVRYLARAIGAASFFAVAAFAVHATKIVDRLEDAVASQPVKAQQITEQYLSAAHFQTPKGRGVQLEFSYDRGITPMLNLSRCSRRSECGLSGSAGRGGRFAGSTRGGRPVGDRPDGHFAAVLARKPDEAITTDDGPEQF
jgi:hypothetical protein